MPVIASGGAGSLEHLSEAITDGAADAVLCASIFHYGDLPRPRREAPHGRGRHPGASLTPCPDPDADRGPRQRRWRTPTRSWPPSAPPPRIPVYLVGGAVRDLLLGRGRADIDLVVVGDAAELAAGLGADGSSTSASGPRRPPSTGHEVDIAGARAESYPEPGALPVVEPAAGIEADLSTARLHDQRDGDPAAAASPA